MMNTETQLDYPELLADLAGIVGEVLQRNGTTQEDAARIAHEAAEAVRRNWGGQLLYLPKGERYELSQRDLQIWNEFNGRNLRRLAQKYGLCDQQVYKVLAKVRASQTRRVQPDLFNDQRG